MAEAPTFPRSVEDIWQDFSSRRSGLLRALTEDVDELYKSCDPERDNLCLYGERTGRWSVDLPAEEVPAELPEPCLGINFARDGMQRKDWLALVAVHSDAWLMAVAFFYAVKLDAGGRARLFKLINQAPTLFEIVTGRAAASQPPLGQGPGPSSNVPRPRKKSEMPPGGTQGVASDTPQPSGRLLTFQDIGPNLRGRKAELFWPDDHSWYLVEIQSVNIKTRAAKIMYSSGEVEELDLNEIVRDGHMSLLAQ